MIWKEIPGTYFKYRINEEAEIQREVAPGEWRTLTPYRSQHSLCIKLKVAPDKWKSFRVMQLMRDAFFGGQRPGYLLAHVTSMTNDCSVYNLRWVTRHEFQKSLKGPSRRAVEKISPQGEVLGAYRCVTEAAKVNFVCPQSVINRCRNRVQDEFKSFGFSFRYTTCQTKKGRPRKVVLQ